jgi:endonuclease/exonuclease/phosphatase family metal-dependent hydrolase
MREQKPVFEKVAREDAPAESPQDEAQARGQELEASTRGEAVSAPPPPGSIRVITYNIRKGKGASGRAKIPMQSLGEALSMHNADVVLCQEVFHSKHGGTDEQTRHLAESLGFHRYYGANKFRAIGHHGNSTFSRLRAEHFRNHDISTNRIEKRGALYVRLALGKLPLHVINVHLGLNRWQRAAQGRFIVKLIDEMCRPHEPVLLAGDFNDWQRSLDRWLVEELGFHNALSGCIPELLPTWPTARPTLCLDRIYTRNLIATNASRLDGAKWRNLSDHLPLLADLQIGDSSGR